MKEKEKGKGTEELPQPKPPVIIEPRIEVSPLIIPEAQGDAADRAQDQIDADLAEQIRRARTSQGQKTTRDLAHEINHLID